MKALDGAGIAKMTTLEDAMLRLQHIHTLVERMGIAVRSNQNTGAFRQQITRSATPLVGLLKPQFGMIADQVAALILALGRGGSDQTRLRTQREYVAQIRTALEISIAQTEKKHAQQDGHSDKAKAE